MTEKTLAEEKLHKEINIAPKVGRKSSRRREQENILESEKRGKN